MATESWGGSFGTPSVWAHSWDFGTTPPVPPVVTTTPMGGGGPARRRREMRKRKKRATDLAVALVAFRMAQRDNIFNGPF